MTIAPDAVPALLSVSDLSVSYGLTGIPGRRRPNVAVDSVSFEIRPGETLGLVGESGSGKSTTGRAILRLLEPASGTIMFDGTDVTAMGARTPLSYRRDVQAVFQDPSSSLNPRHVVSRSVDNALKRHGVRGRDERRQRVLDAFEQVGLSHAHLGRFPSELSGGQQQRVAIARALALQPKLVVCDEAVSALDLSTQSQIINLLSDLQDATGVSFLFIAHDLGIVRHISDRIGVMHQGRLVELDDAESLFTNPRHPYTRALLAASPAAHPEGRDERRARRNRYRTNREVANIARGSEGCSFRNRCARVMDSCHTITPAMQPLGGEVHVACHLYGITADDGTVIQPPVALDDEGSRRHGPSAAL